MNGKCLPHLICLRQKNHSKEKFLLSHSYCCESAARFQVFFTFLQLIVLLILTSEKVSSNFNISKIFRDRRLGLKKARNENHREAAKSINRTIDVPEHRPRKHQRNHFSFLSRFVSSFFIANPSNHCYRPEQ